MSAPQLVIWFAVGAILLVLISVDILLIRRSGPAYNFPRTALISFAAGGVVAEAILPAFWPLGSYILTGNEDLASQLLPGTTVNNLIASAIYGALVNIGFAASEYFGLFKADPDPPG